MLAAILLASLPVLASPGYLRYPDLHGDEIVFTAEGDLWRAKADGSQVRRVTTHAGDEWLARFSPDGKRIAFSASYEGNTDLYVTPADGGTPKRLTWHPDADEALGWLPDGSRILFRSKREDATGRAYEIFSIDPDTGEIEKLPLGWAALLDVDADTGLWAFNRISREYRTWKRYRGGTRQDLWIGDPKKKDYRRIGDFDGPDAFPMWWKGRVYFLSDEGGSGNVWSVSADGKDRRRLTNETTWDLRFPAMGTDGRIVAMRAGDLVLIDTGSGVSSVIPIDLPSEVNRARVRYADPMAFQTWWSLSPDGDRVALVTRGEVFSVATGKSGVSLPVSATSGARESWATYSPDGKRMAWVTDATGEETLVTVDAWGRGDEKTVLGPPESSNKPASADDPKGGWHFPPSWSGDGRWIAWGDGRQNLFVAPIEGGTPKKVDHCDQAEIREYTWSPDGRWLAYSKVDRTGFGSVYVWDTKTGVSHRVTGPTTDDWSPAWDPQGRYLYFLSARTLNPTFGVRDFDYIEANATKPYAMLLRPDVENPFHPRGGLPGAEEVVKKKKLFHKKAKDAEEVGDKLPPPVIDIVFDGIEGRVVEVPVPAGSYWSLGASKDRLYWISDAPWGLNDPAETTPSTNLESYVLEDLKQETFATGVTSYELSRDGLKLGFSRGPGEVYVVGTDAPTGDDLTDAAVDFGNVVLDVDPAAEWRQIFNEGWRLMRDFYWEPAMAGVDWKAEREKYASLLPRVANRDDLKDLMGEMIGELATSHTYVWGGDRPEIPAPVSAGLLGADIVREGEAWKIGRIYEADPADGVRSPLSEPGVEVPEGWYILKVNHRAVAADRPFEAALEARAGVPVVLTVADKAKGGKTKDVVVVPLGEDHTLRYADWVRRNREYVDEKSDGRLAYLHIPDMGGHGLVEFEKWFYPQLQKQGMVVDVRFNGGGFVSQLIVERLRRKVDGFDRSRGGGIWTYPEKTLQGPFVVLTNEFAGSDGDIFPTAIQVEGLAPVLGQRSWGGVVGIRGDKPLVDLGMITEPEYAFWFPKRGWGVENRGVEPDIEVQNMPQDLAEGRDPQLDRAIEECLKLRDTRTWVLPTFDPEPTKTRDDFKKREGK